MTTGARTVTVDAATTWQSFEMTQSSVSGQNSLQLGANLTLGDSSTDVTSIAMDASAGNSTLILDLNGYTLETNGNGINYKLDLDGTVLMGSGSVLQLNNYNAAGTQVLNNAGVLSMDGADIIYDWRATTSNNGDRDFHNSGEWTMKNGSTLTFISTTGRPVSGFQNLAHSTNSGTLSLLSNSSLQFAKLTNTGTIEIGDGTTIANQNASTSEITLDNGANGLITISGNSTLGQAVETGKVIINNGVSASTGGVITVGNGADTPTWEIVGNDVAFNNNTGNTLTINQGATLHMRGFDDGLPHPHVNRPTTLNNTGGTVNLSGKLIFQPNLGSAPVTVIENSGLFSIDGSSASIEKAANPRGDRQPQFNNNAGGSLRGDGVMTYVNSTGKSVADTLLIANSGNIEVGNGSNGTLLESVGTLELVNTRIVFAAGGGLIFDIGGETSGLYDVLTVSGTGAGIDLTTAGDSVTFNLVNGYSPVGNMSWTVLNAPVTGTFDTVNLPTSPGGSWSFDESTGLLSVSVIPEPSSLLLMLIGGSFFCLTRRRKS